MWIRTFLCLSTALLLCFSIGLTSACGGSECAGLANPKPADQAAVPCGTSVCRCVNGRKVCSTKTCPAPCTYQNKQFASGLTFPAGDSCNRCSCDAGRVRCTTKTCEVTGPDCSPTKACPAGFGCKYPLGICGQDVTGKCTKMPKVTPTCTRGITKACGCDGKDHESVCGDVIFNQKLQHAGKCGSICVTGDRSFIVNDKFRSPIDSCNTCKCVKVNEKVAISCTKYICPEPLCKYNGSKYEYAEEFSAKDGCNTCTCGYWGKIKCTTKSCNVKTCDYQGKTYKPGESQEDADKCNKCTCGNDGKMTCVKQPCGPPKCAYNGKSYRENETFPAGDGCNTCLCKKDGSFECTKKTC